MQYRRLGRTELHVSVVGFGTCQLRLVPERQAIETLIRGFELGVNLVHTAPDYEGAEDLVARAIATSGRDVIVCTQAYDVHGNSSEPVAHFERLFEEACARFDRERLELFGIACIDDREALGENVWGAGGMVEFLQEKQAEGRIGATFCSTHGHPDYLRKLLDADVFDALMVACNPLGFHLLTVADTPARRFEDIAHTRAEVLPLAAERDVGLMLMKPLAGGILCEGGAFEPRRRLLADGTPVRAGEVLREVLAIPGVACVVPGTASVAEADENARAGHAPLANPPEVTARVMARVAELRAEVCSRCGECEPTCSQSLPVSWLFRAGYVATQRSETFETWNEVDYFHLHGNRTATCVTCPDRSCVCPVGIDIPRELAAVHADMLELRRSGAVRPPQDSPRLGDDALGARLLLRDVPRQTSPDAAAGCRVWLENAGVYGWHRGTEHDVELRVFVGRRRSLSVRLRHDVHVGGRAHFAFELPARRPGHYRLRLELATVRRWRRHRVVLDESTLEVRR